ncbi:hypothetical protein Tsubulata_049586 [Turnera subulata]|uniref:RING-type E3 ubiquitin transferase n=1 Tax=Turnera subulata TaxID=218843 RepID=A0A9Q0F247_9ROSI|nr:hypothetical protein Tsubulata_049586 [Turnera subulata]
MSSSLFQKHGRVFITLSLLLLLTRPYEVVGQQPSPPGGETQNPYGYARVTPSMAIIIVVLIAALFFMGFFSIYIRHCSDSAAAGSVRPLGLGGAAGRSRRAAAAARGLDPAVIETFPTLVYSVVKGLKIGKGALECAVCLNEFEDDETLRLIPKCDHVFHPECIDAWLESHTTCPVCRANLVPEPGETTPELSELHPELADLEAQNGGGSQGEGHEHGQDHHVGEEVQPPQPEVINVNGTLNRSRTRGSRSGRPPKFPRSHSTGHSLVQPGENTDRFTLRLPAEVRKQIMNQELNRTLSMVVLPRGGSSRSGYRMPADGSSRGRIFNYKRLERVDQGAKSDRWIFNRTPSFLARASTFLTRAASIKSPKGATKDNEGGSTRSVKPEVGESSRPPV